jgi:hypothetical protein
MHRLALVFVLAVAAAAGYSQTDSPHRKITGHYEGDEPLCRLRMRIHPWHVITAYRKCEANPPVRTRARWKMEGKVMVVTGWFAAEQQKWVIENGSIFILEPSGKRRLAHKE